MILNFKFKNRTANAPVAGAWPEAEARGRERGGATVKYIYKVLRLLLSEYVVWCTPGSDRW